MYLLARCGTFGARHRSSHSDEKESLMRYAVVIEKGKTSYGAYVPDLPGCVAVGETREEAERLIREAIQFHLDGLREEGLPIPEPTSRVEYVEA
jgi:predicted RNase H-like HicB family nuclease